MEQEILNRFNQLKSNVQHMWDRYSFHEISDLVKDKIHRLTEGDNEVHPIHIDNYQYESHYPDDDLPLTLSKDSGPGVQYYDTENSPLSRGQPKVTARGIDKFDDEDDEVFEEDIRRPSKTKPRAKKVVRKKKTIH